MGDPRWGFEAAWGSWAPQKAMGACRMVLHHGRAATATVCALRVPAAVLGVVRTKSEKVRWERGMQIGGCVRVYNKGCHAS